MNSITVFRLLTFTFALGIGFLFGSNVGQPEPVPSQYTGHEVQNAQDSAVNQTSSRFVNQDEMDLEEVRLVCRDERVRRFWHDLVREPKFTKYLFRSKLSAKYDCSDLLTVEEEDLNGDGKNEYMVAANDLTFCSPTGNCVLAIYGIFDDEKSQMRTSNGVYDFRVRRLLYMDGVMVDPETQIRTSNGFRDLVLRHNGSSYNDNLFLLKFDGELYRVRRCYEEDKGTGRESNLNCKNFPDLGN